MPSMLRRLLHSAFAFVPFLAAAAAQTAPRAPIPTIASSWWQIAGNPNLGPLQNPLQEPVDFAIWQAADGTWQLWSCIRHTSVGGATRLFHRWQSNQLTDTNWTPLGVALLADPAFGEIPGGLQAPHVFRANGYFYMIYGDFLRICMLRSTDGKNFTRMKNEIGQPNLFDGPWINVRDPMVLRVGALHLCYYTSSPPTGATQAAVFLRTSFDLKEWSQPMVVSAGGAASVPINLFDAECPFVVERNGWYYLFRNQTYGANAQNTQYASKNPFDFGVDDDKYRLGTLPVAAPEIVLHQGHWYIAALNPMLDGIRLARLNWVP